MTTPNDAQLIGPPPRPSDEELAAMPTVAIPWQRPAPPPQRRGAPLAVVALINTLLAALVGAGAVLVLVLLTRVSLGQRPSGLEVPIALAGWLLGHGVPLQTPIGQIGVAPLSVALLAVWRLIRAGVHTTRGAGARATLSVRRSLEVAGWIGAVYGVLGSAVAWAINRPELSVTPWRAGLHLFVVGAVAGLAGSVRTTGALRAVARATPHLIRDGIRTGVVGALILLGIGAGLVGVAIASNGGEAVQIFRAYPSGVAGQAGVTLVCLAFAPNLAGWAVAYLLGPGFAVGSGTTIKASGVTIGEMPPLPALAGLPDRPLDGPLWVLMALPLIAGVVASLLMVRRRLRPRRSRSGDTIVPVPRWWRMAGSAALAGVVAGLVLAAMTLAASGRLDGGRPFPVGAVPWQVAAFAALAIGLGGLLGVAGARVWQKQKRAA